MTEEDQLMMMLAGVHTDKRPPGEVFDAVPGATLTRQFVKDVIEPGYDLIGKVETLCTPTWQADGTPLLSFKPNMEDVLAGDWDSALTELARYLESKPPIVVILHHEPEDDYPGPELATVFAEGFNCARSILKDTYPDLPVAYCAMGYQWRPGSTATANPDPWRSVQADLYLCDVYSGNSFPAGAILPEHDGFVRWKSEIVDCMPDRRWGVGERGIMANPLRALTIMRERDWLLDEGADCQLWLWWNTGGTEQEDGWPIDPTLNPVEGQLVRELIAAFVVPEGYVLLDADQVVCADNGALVHRPWLVRHIDWMDSLG